MTFMQTFFFGQESYISRHRFNILFYLGFYKLIEKISYSIGFSMQFVKSFHLPFSRHWFVRDARENIGLEELWESEDNDLFSLLKVLGAS